jgi:hypothetical protein
MAKGGKKEAAELGFNYFGIMLDYEVDNVQDYWPVRSATIDIEELKRKIWIGGDVGFLPMSEWEATLKLSKSLSPEGMGQTYTGGIYAFSYVGQGG